MTKWLPEGAVVYQATVGADGKRRVWAVARVVNGKVRSLTNPDAVWNRKFSDDPPPPSFHPILPGDPRMRLIDAWEMAVALSPESEWYKRLHLLRLLDPLLEEGTPG